MKPIMSVAPGKVILTGEHSVVHGKSALIAAIDLTTTVTIEADPTIQVSAPSVGFAGALEMADVIDYWQHAREAWQRMIELGETSAWEQYSIDPMVIIKASLGLVYDEFRACGGVRMQIASTIPMGSGLGSSASVATAIIGGLGTFFGANWTQEELYERVYMVEQLAHGRASGADPAAIIAGGLVEFVKIGEKKSFVPHQWNDHRQTFGLLHSGKPTETTGQMVAMVHKQLLDVTTAAETLALIEQMGVLSTNVIAGIEKGNLGWDWMTTNEVYLEKLGVVSAKTKALLATLHNQGFQAKVCGAGGVDDGSGMILVYDEDEERLRASLPTFKLPYYQVRLGAPGWQIQ